MAQPEQVLPSWLTFSRSVVTNAAGAPVSTSTTILYLPLTYYGPSIPLGSDWTYGGLSSPTATPSRTLTTPTATPTPLTTPSATPSTRSLSSSRPTGSVTSTTRSTPISTTSHTTTATSSRPASSRSATSAPSSTSSQGSPLPTGIPASSQLSKPALIGAILGAILGSVVLLLVLLLYVRLRVARRARAHSSLGGWSIVDAGDGSPRHSGEEVDPFLRRNGVYATPPSNILQPGAGPTARLVSPPAVSQSGNAHGANRGRGVSMAPTVSSTHTANSGNAFGAGPAGSDTSSSNSGYGNLLLEGHIIPPGDLMRDAMEYQTRTQYPSSELERTEEVDEPPEERSKPSPVPEHPEYLDELTENPENYSPLAPPRAINPDRVVGFAHIPNYPYEKPSMESRRSSFPMDADEAPLLLTAQRVRVQDLAPRAQALDGPGPATSAWAGITGFAKNILGSLSSRRGSRLTLNSRPASARSSAEREQNRALLGSELSEKAELGLRLRIADAERPTSKYSEKSGGSGNTIYHDAVSRPITPLLSPLPRALTPAGGGGTPPYTQTAFSRPDSYYGIPADPPAYDYDEHRTRTPVSPFGHARAMSMEVPSGMDILDIPVPQRISPFASATSLSSGDTGNRLAFPPGLITTLPTPAVWRHTAGTTPSPGSYGVGSSLGDLGGVSIDLLEEAPPSAGEGWRTLSQFLASDSDRRTTFGGGLPNIVHAHHPSISEAGSYHSHITPNSANGSSVHALTGSVNSGSSRPSAHSHARSGHSGVSAGSVSSNGRLRMRGAISPSLSALGRERLSPPPRSRLGVDVVGVEAVPSLTSATSVDTSTGTLQTDMTTDVMTEETAGPGMHYLNAPWASGLDSDWNPTY